MNSARATKNCKKSVLVTLACYYNLSEKYGPKLKHKK
jgi:hypothetical protein